MTFPEVQFVAAPEDGAEVLFDFNDNFGEAPAAIISGSFSLGTPSIEGDPDGLGVQYGPREASFSLLIYGNRHAAMQTQALLARTFMLRRRGWLRVCLDEFSTPVWLRTYTPTPAELDFALIAPESHVDAWQIEVTIAAEPFIRGERIELWSGTINNDPAHATNPMGVTLPDAIGDAAAPLRIEATFNGGRADHDIALSCAAVPDGFVPIVWQVGTDDGWTLAADMSAPVPNATVSGGSYRSVTSFGTTPTMSTRLAGTSTGPVPPAGRYRVFARAASNDTFSVFAMQFGYRTGNGDMFAGSPRAVLDRESDDWTWVDLGSFEFPLPRSDIDMPAAANAPTIALAAERVSGTGTMFLDVIMAIPEALVDVSSLESWEKSDLLVSEFVTIGPPSGQAQVWDGDSEVTARMIPGGGVDAQIGAANRGKFPTVRPGLDNRLTLLQQTRSGPSGSYLTPDALADTAVVVVSYQPRLLWLGED